MLNLCAIEILNKIEKALKKGYRTASFCFTSVLGNLIVLLIVQKHSYLFNLCSIALLNNQKEWNLLKSSFKQRFFLSSRAIEQISNSGQINTLVVWKYSYLFNICSIALLYITQRLYLFKSAFEQRLIKYE